MRVKKSETKPTPRTRSLKIQPVLRAYVSEDKTVPEIRLCGNWLAKLGFEYGKRVTITTREELLVIQVQTQ